MSDNLYALPEIFFIAGENQTLNFDLYRDKDLPAHITTEQCQFSLSPYSGHAAAPLFVINGVITTNADHLSTAKIILQSQQTVDLRGKYIYQFTIKNASGKVNVLQGIFNIRENVNKQFV